MVAGGPSHAFGLIAPWSEWMALGWSGIVLALLVMLLRRLPVIIDWIIGRSVNDSEAITSILFAILTGGIVLNVLKEELPEERQSRFLPVASGAAGYSALLLIA